MATFPLINADSVLTQLPYSECDDFVTQAADLDCGFSFTESQNVEPLKRWVLQYPSITDAERAVLEAFFEEMNGALGEFEFSGNDGSVYPYTRFDMDALTVSYPEPGRQSVTIKLAAQPPPS